MPTLREAPINSQALELLKNLRVSGDPVRRAANGRLAFSLVFKMVGTIACITGDDLARKPHIAAAWLGSRHTTR
jgi:hypothetical protein